MSVPLVQVSSLMPSFWDTVCFLLRPQGHLCLPALVCYLNLGITKSSLAFLLNIHLLSLVPLLVPSLYLPASSGEKHEKGGKQVAFYTKN